MIYISKERPPKSFVEYKQEAGARFDDMPTIVKTDLRQTLLAEQGYLCAYCMTRIADDGAHTKIEHLHSRNPQNELDYQNLLAVCHGGEGCPKKHQTCDSRKGHKELHVSPLDADDMDTIYYDYQGHILSKDESIKQELDQILNLNDEEGYLIHNRQRTLLSFQKQVRKKMGDKPLSSAQMEKLLRLYECGENGKKRPYCGIVIWYLRKRLGLWKK